MDYNKFKNHCLAQTWFYPDARYLLACSGGMDSMAMLHLFYTLSEEMDSITIHVGHINHQLRTTAAADAQFVREYCSRYNIGFTARNVNVESLIRQSGMSVEMAARELRYAALESLRNETRTQFIVTAHTASDQAETVLMRLIQGTSPRGLQGIREERGNLIRPLLPWSREEISQYVLTENIPYHNDPSNADKTIQRNWIRHELIPAIEDELNPRVTDALTRLSQIESEVENYLEYQALQALRETSLRRSSDEIILDIRRFQNYFTVIQKTLIINCLMELGTSQNPLNFTQLEQIMQMIHGEKSGSRMAIPGGLLLMIDRNQLLLTRRRQRQQVEQEFSLGQPTNINGWVITSELLTDVTSVNFSVSKEKAAYFDWDELQSANMEWRTWNAGDSMAISHGHTKKVSDIFIDSKVPVWDKHRMPLFTAGDRILWIPGVKRSVDAWVTATTATILKLEIETSK